MADVIFNCPECKTTLKVDETGVGQTVDCPSCRKKILIPAPTVAAGAAYPSAPASQRTATPETAPGAIWSLVLGILGLICLGPLAAIPAIICGHVTYAKVRRSAGALGGNGMAVAGLVLGYVSLVVWLVVLPLQLAIAIPAFVKARSESQSRACVNNLRIMDAAKEQAAMEHGWTAGKPIDGDPAAVPQVLSYVKGNQLPVCPANGTYTLNPLGESPSCSIGGKHALP